MAPLRTGRRLFAVANIATVLSVSLWAASAAAPAAVPNSSKQDAVSGARYLAGLIGSKGYLTSSDGSPDDPNTANAILAMHAAGFGGIAAHAAESYLQAHRDAFVTRNGQDDAGRLATAILAAHAEGTNPRQYGGTDAHADLVGRLLATQRTTGKDAGLFGSTDPSFDGAFRQGLALLALSSVGQRNAPALAWLQAQQCAGGGWESYRADASVACGKTDPAAFSGPDTNSTALAVEAFVAAGVAPAHDPLPFLHGQQSSGGGFASFGGPTIAADPDSTGLVLQALVALGQNPAGASWTRPGGTPFTALAGFQLSSGAAAGAYFFDTKSRKPSVLATVQAVPGAAGAPLPIGPGQLAPGGAVTGPTSAAPSTSAASGGATPTGAAPTATTPAATTPAALTPRGTAAPQLPNTGSRDVLPLTVTGAGLLLAGAAAVAGSRRRTAGGSHRS
jgi:LPXTG-motif cell wall-anchored protein